MVSKPLLKPERATPATVYIAKPVTNIQLCGLHNGTITLKDSKTKNMVMEIQLPATPTGEGRATLLRELGSRPRFLFVYPNGQEHEIRSKFVSLIGKTLLVEVLGKPLVVVPPL